MIRFIQGLLIVNDKNKSDSDVLIEGTGKGVGSLISFGADKALMKNKANSLTRQILSNYAGGYSENKVNESIKLKLNQKSNKMEK